MTRPAASPGMRVRIIGHLRDGYGADDIAVRLRQHPGFVRRVIAELRAEGVFKQPGFFRPATWGRP